MAQLKNTTIDGILEIKSKDEDNRALILPEGSKIYVGNEPFQGGEDLITKENISNLGFITNDTIGGDTLGLVKNGSNITISPDGSLNVNAEATHIQSDWNATESNRGAIKNKPALKGGEGKNSLIGLNNSQAIGDKSIALGINTIAGCKGYYIKAIDPVNGFLYLSNRQTKPIASEDAFIDTNFETPKYEEGDYFVIVNDLHYVCISKILWVANNQVAYDQELGLGFNAIYDDNNIEIDGYSFCVPTKPTVGIVSLAYQAFAMGENNIAAGRSSVAFGRDTVALDDYAFVEGRANSAGYAAHAEGFQNIALGESSHAEGCKTKSTGYNSHAEGRETESYGKYSHAEGYLTDANGETAHAEGHSSEASGEAAHAEGCKTVASGYNSHAEGRETDSIGRFSHAEGYLTEAMGEASHAEGQSTTTNGLATHAEGLSTTAVGEASHAEGRSTTANSLASHAEGLETTANDIGAHAEGCGSEAFITASHAEGYYTKTYGTGAHSEGYETHAGNPGAHAEGRQSVAAGHNSHAEGFNTWAEEINCHAEGSDTSACNNNAHAEGASSNSFKNIKEANKEYNLNDILDLWTNKKFSIAYGKASHVEGIDCIAFGERSHAEGYRTKAIGDYTHSEGNSTTASGSTSHTEGSNTQAKGLNTHAEGSGAIAEGESSHAEGSGSKSIGLISHAEGKDTTANGYGSHTEGRGTIASRNYSHAQGSWNIEDTNKKYIHIVGGGTSATKPANFHTIDGTTGDAWYQGKIESNGEDYAEYFEWQDGNPGNEDRIGLLVTLDGEQIKLANEGDEVLGIISGTVAVLGGTYECEWNGKYLTDDFGRIIYEDVEEFDEVIIDNDAEGNPIIEKQSLGFFKHPKLNPNYDPTKEYINRADRQEWDAVGMLGKLYVRDDGTCIPNFYATVGENGIATSSLEKTNMRVLSRVNENVIRVLLK